MRHRLLLLVLLGAVVAACTTGGDSATDADRAREAGGADASGSESVLAFTATTIDGGQIDVGELEGRDVVLFFWAPW